MSDLFDLPFEEEPEEPLDERATTVQRPTTNAQRPTTNDANQRPITNDQRPTPPRRVLTVRAHDPRARSARDRVLRGVGGRRAVELPALAADRPSVLHAQRRIDADPRRDLSIGAAVSEVQTGRWPSGR